MILITIHDEATGRSTTLRAEHAVVVTACDDGADDVDVAVCTAGRSDLACEELLNVAHDAISSPSVLH